MDFIVKADPDTDWYCCWSDNVDQPMFWGSRAELQTAPERIRFDRHGDRFGDDRFARADEYGTSCMLLEPTRVRFYDWTASGFVYNQEGWLPRARLRALCERLEADQPVTGLLEPLEA